MASVPFLVLVFSVSGLATENPLFSQMKGQWQAKGERHQVGSQAYVKISTVVEADVLSDAQGEYLLSNNHFQELLIQADGTPGATRQYDRQYTIRQKSQKSVVTDATLFELIWKDASGASHVSQGEWSNGAQGSQLRVLQGTPGSASMNIISTTRFQSNGQSDYVEDFYLQSKLYAETHLVYQKSAPKGFFSRFIPRSNPNPDYATCRNVVDHLQTETDATLIYNCINAYFVNVWDEQEGFQIGIKLGLRYLELEPINTEIYNQVAWYYYSQWASWYKRQQAHPDDSDTFGKTAMDQALGVLNQGLRFPQNDANPDYHYQAGNTIWVAAATYGKVKPELMPFANQRYNTAVVEALSQNPLSQAYRDIAIQSELTLGRIAFSVGNRPLALTWFEKVLVLEPANPIAQRWIVFLKKNPQS